MPELHLTLSIHVAFLMIAGLCSIAGALLVYRVTIPPVSSSTRITLISLRSLGLFLLFLLIAEPLLSLITHWIDRPITAVLVDNSQSMTIHDRGGQRDKILKSILRSPVWQQIGNNGRVAYALFDGNARNLTDFSADSCSLQGEETDITKALKFIKQTFQSSNLQSVVLITDGNSTVGMNPVYEAEELGIPVFAIGVGDTNEQKDLLVRKVLTNEITYIGTKVPVNVTVHSAGFDGEKIQVSLRDGSVVLDEKLLILERGIQDYLIPLSFIPGKEGVQKFSVDISHLPGELTAQNNHMSFFTKVLKSKLRVALVAGAPNQDVAFIRRALTNDKNIDVKPFIERNDGQFYENSLTMQELKDFDCILLVGFPMLHTNQHSLQIILDAANSAKPLFIVLSRTIDFDKLQILEPVLPFGVHNIIDNELQVFVNVPESQRNNSILKIGNDVPIVGLWNKLPPVFQLQGAYRPKIESEVLAGVRIQSTVLDRPFIVARNLNRNKSLAVLGYGLWRWNMLSDIGSGTENMLDHFISNAIRWLTTQEDARQIRVQTSKHIYTTQDAVEFIAQVYDENYQPLDNAEIEVHARYGNIIYPLTLNSLGNGQYQGAYDRLQSGEYKFTATVKVNGMNIGSDQGNFSVGGINVEYLETRMNKILLQQIALQTGGQYYDINEFGSLPSDVTILPNFQPREMSKSAEIEIWNSRWMMVFVVFVFALEWFMRKRNGML